MNAIALDNRLGIHFESNGVYNACEALPIHQSTLTYDEMAAIDGLWDWQKFNSDIYDGMILGGTAALLGIGLVALVTPPGWVVAGATLGTGIVAGGATGGVGYALKELKKKLTPEASKAKSCCSCSCRQ